MRVWSSSTGSGKRGSTIITNPNTAAFETTPESTAATSGVDCVRSPQPAVEREERRLDREGGEEAEEDPVVRARAAALERERALLTPKATIEASISSEPAIV